MGTLFVLVAPCFRETVVVTCKIRSFLCNLDNLLQKNVTVSFFGNQISKWRSFEKRAIFDLLFNFFSHQGKVTKKSFSTYLTHIHTYMYFAHPIDFFCLNSIEKKYHFDSYHVYRNASCLILGLGSQQQNGFPLQYDNKYKIMYINEVNWKACTRSHCLK